jgi:hypothetical protein
MKRRFMTWGEVSVGGVSVFSSFEIFKCDGAFDVLLGKPWLHSVQALHNYETDEIRIQSSEHKTVLYNEPQTVRDTPRRTPEQATMGPANMGGQSEVDAAHAQAEHAVNTAHVRRHPPRRSTR